MLRHAENGKKISNHHTLHRVRFAAHQAVTIKARVSCELVCNFGIVACIVLADASIYRTELVKN
jgi:hypothetical protein